VRAVVLAAGYATRLYPLTERIAKPLLPLAGRPMIERLLDRIAAVPGLDAVHVVTNAKFAPAFAAWARGVRTPLPLHVHDDGTTSEEDRLGAIGDLRFVVERERLHGEDLLVIAGDNLFDFDLGDLVGFRAARGTASALAVYEHPDRSVLSEYGILELDADDRVVSFVEKPAEPASNLVATAAYLFDREHVALLDTYLAGGNSPDQPGKLVAWLVPREPVYGYRFSGEWVDIGDANQLLEADNELRRRAGMPERDVYAPD